MKAFFELITVKNILDIITGVTAIINVIIVALVFKLTKKDLNPKLYVNATKTDIADRYSKLYNMEIDEMDFNQKGFPEIGHEGKLWEIKLHNNGDLPATNVVVNLSIIIKKSEFEDGKFLGDIVNHRFVDYKQIPITYKFDYIPPNGSETKPLLYLDGRFPYATLRVEKLVSTERTFIKNTTQISYYKHPLFDEIGDAQDYNLLLGAFREVSADKKN